MDLAAALLTIAGLVLFETICSIDNAIINADILATMSGPAHRWFLLWGLLLAVVVIRGLRLSLRPLHRTARGADRNDLR
ncbi:MAG: DUF475 domain-containing protein [Methanomicrobiales archaeon]